MIKLIIFYRKNYAKKHLEFLAKNYGNLAFATRACACLLYESAGASRRRDKHTHAQIRKVAVRKSEGARRCPLNRFGHFSAFRPFAYFPFYCVPYSEHLICRLIAICLTAFLFLRICLFVWHCPIILPKVNGVKSCFRIFLFVR